MHATSRLALAVMDEHWAAVWRGHFYPRPLKAMAGAFEPDLTLNTGGQECPPHTETGRT